MKLSFLITERDWKINGIGLRCSVENELTSKKDKTQQSTAGAVPRKHKIQHVLLLFTVQAEAPGPQPTSLMTSVAPCQAGGFLIILPVLRGSLC